MLAVMGSSHTYRAIMRAFGSIAAHEVATNPEDIDVVLDIFKQGSRKPLLRNPNPNPNPNPNWKAPGSLS